jgi:hypothetical protein
MDTDLDPDDAIGRRLRALHTWVPSVPIEDAWQGVEHRRRRRRSQRYVAAAAVVVIAAVGTVAIVGSTRVSHRRVIVAPNAPPLPPIVHELGSAPAGAIKVSPAGPYRSGQSVSARVLPSDAFRLEDPANQDVEVCFAYGDGEICDGATQSRYLAGVLILGESYDVTLPGWVHTPTGLQPCSAVGCRLEIANGNGARIGTPALVIASGPKPVEPARIDAVHTDGTISVRIDALRPDPSWVALNLPNAAVFPPGNLAVCAFAERLLCDGLVRPDPPPFDGAPHDLVIRTNRLLLTSRGWVDCVKYVCAIVLSRATTVTSFGGSFGSSEEILAIVPYRLPKTTPLMARPSLTIASAGPFAVDDTVTVTLHHPPPNVDAAHRLRLGQCASDDLRRTMDCVTRFHDDSQQSQSWTRLADGSLQQRWRIAACNDARGCYLAVEPVVKGHPEVARTPGRFTVSP